MPFFEKGAVRIRYEDAGRDFPLLLTPGGGLDSRASNWRTAVFNSMEIFRDELRCITMDQRNANGGESTGPIPAASPWDAFAEDQLGLMDHLGIERFLFKGNCMPERRHHGVPVARSARAEGQNDREGAALPVNPWFVE